MLLFLPLSYSFSVRLSSSCIVHMCVYAYVCIWMCVSLCLCLCVCVWREGCVSRAAGPSCSYSPGVSQAGDILIPFFFNQVVARHWSLTMLTPTAPHIDCSHLAVPPLQWRKNSSDSLCSMHYNLRLPDPGLLFCLIETQGDGSTIIIHQNSGGSSCSRSIPCCQSLYSYQGQLNK